MSVLYGGESGVLCAGERAVCCAYLPSAVILINEISAGVPMNAPDAPATIPTHRQTGVR